MVAGWGIADEQRSESSRDPHIAAYTLNQFNSNLAAREPDSKWCAVEIIDKNSILNKQCAYMYIGAGRDVWSGLGVTIIIIIIINAQIKVTLSQ